MVLLVRAVAHQLKGERSGTQVPLHSSDRLIAIGKSNAVLGFLEDESRFQSPLKLLSNVQVGHVIFPYLCFFVIGMIPVVHRTFLQNKVSAIPNSESTDQLKHGLCTVRGFNCSCEPFICSSVIRVWRAWHWNNQENKKHLLLTRKPWWCTREWLLLSSCR